MYFLRSWDHMDLRSSWILGVESLWILLSFKISRLRSALGGRKLRPDGNCQTFHQNHQIFYLSLTFWKTQQLRLSARPIKVTNLIDEKAGGCIKMRDEWKNLISMRTATLFTMGLRRDLVLRNFETSPCRIRPDCACTQWCTDRLRPRRSPRWRGHRDTNGPISSALTKADEMKKRSFSSFQYSSCFYVGTSPVTKDIWCTHIYIYTHTFIGILEYTVRISVLTDDGNGEFD